MLQAYKVHTLVSINNKAPYRLWLSEQTGLAEDFEPKIVNKIYTFDEVVDSNAAGLDCILVGRLWPFKIPYVKIQYSWSAEERYLEFDSLTITKVYEPYNITMNELFDEFSAEQCIKYLKDRGMSACPIIK